jgi:uncharacterized membrane protein YfcA
MKFSKRSFLSRLDDTVRWTGIPARVAAAMPDSPPSDRRHRPLRWFPIWPIAAACALFVLSFSWPKSHDLMALLPSLGVMIVALGPGIHRAGPLGRPSLDDDEREAALRQESLLFCLGLIACLNGLGQPLLMVLTYAQNWHMARVVSVASSALMLNATLFGCLPTLYASWKLPPDREDAVDGNAAC